MTGESYAGIYIPTLLMWIKDDPIFNIKVYSPSQVKAKNKKSKQKHITNELLKFVSMHWYFLMGTFNQIDRFESKLLIEFILGSCHWKWIYETKIVGFYYVSLLLLPWPDRSSVSLFWNLIMSKGIQKLH